MKRPHVWSCRHCDFVKAYRCERENQIRLSETIEHWGESVITFKQWLINAKGMWESA